MVVECIYVLPKYRQYDFFLLSKLSSDSILLFRMNFFFQKDDRGFKINFWKFFVFSIQKMLAKLIWFKERNLISGV